MKRRFSSQFLGMNSTVVYREEAAYLVDPGVFPWELERIKRFLSEQEFRRVSLLFTHTHGDHISGWYAFRSYPAFGHRVIARKPPAVRENDVRYIRGVWRKQSIENLDDLQFPSHLQYLSDGEILDIPPTPAIFFHTPGHSADMSVIILPEEKMMFSGDMLIQTPMPFVLHSTREYWTSLNKIRHLAETYNVQCLIPGHGKPAENSEEILERIQREKDYLRHLVREGITLARSGLDGDELRRRLLKLAGPNGRFHAHQVNVQTFLRELNDWLLVEKSDIFED